MTHLIAPRSLLTVIAIGAVVLGVPALLAKEPPKEWDGLVRVEKKNLDHVYILPDATLTGYKRIRLDPTQVSFDKNWKPNDREKSLSRRLSTEDIEKIRNNVATEFRKVFSEVLEEGGYKLVDEDGEDVLRVTPGIANLYVTAPDKMEPGRNRTYVASAGHMTLIVELRDSATGQLLGRAVDHVQGRETGSMELATSVSNAGEAREHFKKWAYILRKGLEDANARPAT
jgi:hypothetical protein